MNGNTMCSRLRIPSCDALDEISADCFRPPPDDRRRVLHFGYGSRPISRRVKPPASADVSDDTAIDELWRMSYIPHAPAMPVIARQPCIGTCRPRILVRCAYAGNGASAQNFSNYWRTTAF
jgi:hypothetical protein